MSTIIITGKVANDDAVSGNGNEYIMVEPLGVGNAAMVYIFGAPTPRNGGPTTGEVREFVLKPMAGVGMERNFSHLHSEVVDSATLKVGAKVATAEDLVQRTGTTAKAQPTKAELAAYSAKRAELNAARSRKAPVASTVADAAAAPAPTPVTAA